jgi:hypothetical protein
MTYYYKPYGGNEKAFRRCALPRAISVHFGLRIALDTGGTCGALSGNAASGGPQGRIDDCILWGSQGT